MSTMDADPVIVVADPSHAALVHRVAREAAAHEDALDALSTDTSGWQRLLANERVVVLIALVHGQPVGYAAAVRTLDLRTGRSAIDLDDLYVRPSARNRGIGEALLRATADWHDGDPVRWEVEEGNLAGQRFALRIGARLRRKVVAWWKPTAR